MKGLRNIATQVRVVGVAAAIEGVPSRRGSRPSTA